MNKIDNKFLLTGSKFMLEYCLKDNQELLIGLLDHLLIIKITIQNFKETADLKHIYKNELDKSCFANDATYSDSKDSAKRTVSDKILQDRAYEIAINPK